MKNQIIVNIRRHPGYFLAFTVSATTFYFLIMANSIFIRTVTRLRALQNSTTIRRNDSFSETSSIFLEHGLFNSNHSVNIETSNQTRLILLWSSMFDGFQFLQTGRRSFIESSCPERRCEITSDRNRLVESDAVVFHLRTLTMTDIPRNRNSHQKWIFFSLESPAYSHFHGLAFMYGMFNWTMTYRNDSDIVMPYGKIIPYNKKGFTKKDLYSMWNKKTKMAAWMVSHCITDSNREEYVKEMKKYIDVVTFGECGIAVCPFNKTKECLNNFSNQFYFYLAFENAICDDYITEKFYRTLHYEMIPVVFGGGKYSAVAPLGSYIDAMDFRSPKDLSFYLYKVASNFSLFAEYFRWKTEGYVIQDMPDPCALCEKLHSKSFDGISVYHDIQKWWIGQSHCRRWSIKAITRN